MKVHHLNCGSMSTPFGPFVCHVLLLETERSGLVLVDSGFGTADIADPRRRLGPTRHLLRPALDPAETALRQVEALGHSAADVQHVVVTHLDYDHIGGLSDFPHAQVHLTAAEAQGGLRTPSLRDARRFRPQQWSHGPRFVEHADFADTWLGFGAAKQLDQVADGLVLVPLPGHTRGHTCVAVDTGGRWLLHVGDAAEHRGWFEDVPVPRGVRLAEWMLATDRSVLGDNRRRLRELARHHAADVDIVTAHDPVQLERFRPAP
ncbi:MBL fold metallo-hydrolase [Nocardioides daphniae]|uniref:Metallo-hydrolase n=1 Tax=Nocardioides daphniae TaxID=402297 RepID=A0A4P7UDU7_9ACTN|nr:MBL fold metallo-hydrolase [Nocardioides daphniae]QCC77555.1 MBL fold metallo-hydrolase [Nocardioides daphniae]GGD30822.1 putative metallo-hydrolase [Nocardioides daphniae]